MENPATFDIFAITMVEKREQEISWLENYMSLNKTESTRLWLDSNKTHKFILIARQLGWNKAQEYSLEASKIFDSVCVFVATFGPNGKTMPCSSHGLHYDSNDECPICLNTYLNQDADNRYVKPNIVT